MRKMLNEWRKFLVEGNTSIEKRQPWVTPGSREDVLWAMENNHEMIAALKALEGQLKGADAHTAVTHWGYLDSGYRLDPRLLRLIKALYERTFKKFPEGVFVVDPQAKQYYDDHFTG